jgi:predicted metal-dependent hydrolase
VGFAASRAAPPAPTIEEPMVAELPGGPLAYTLRRSARARRVRVVVDARQGVVVTVPGGRRLAAGDGRRLGASFVAERETWIRGHVLRHAAQLATLASKGPLRAGSFVLYAGRDHRLEFAPSPASARRSTVLRDAGAAVLIVRLAARDDRPPARVLRDWCRSRAREALEAAIATHAPAFDREPTAISVRDQRTRWGSASRTGRLSFSWRLILAPPDALDTVVVHELAHLRMFGHGPRFWSLVATRRPDHREWRRWLREHSVELHASLED